MEGERCIPGYKNVPRGGLDRGVHAITSAFFFFFSVLSKKKGMGFWMAV